MVASKPTAGGENRQAASFAGIRRPGGDWMGEGMDTAKNFKNIYKVHGVSVSSALSNCA